MSCSWACTGAIEFAAIVPDAATPGKPIPGKLGQKRELIETHH
jgi:hypothetical protein